ncbi:hypothetical protein CROQUDRAFT_662876 [Cronartium quercuum f. sp. fusiforme G11]|uniref:TECPR1-like DysF domain-containing protein n=1 Tax=Cronartium quercuum f. sp. fusiforme G11 TaxID=708437 RepID=A0A9P6T7P9_9BASI|nr:hypothetical protein CROQUDRAFT_662876 [Cronartium quercuum f. sp. fusiforme G11]
MANQLTSSNPNQSPTSNEKESLSVQTTTVNFKNFVSKSGPIFWFQDVVEEILTWKDPSRTFFWAGTWACLCLYPILFTILPNLIIISILLYTYPTTRENDASNDIDGNHAPLPSNEPSEGSVDYLSNMQNIQIMMGRISQASDVVKTSLVPYLNWSTPRFSLALLHASILSAILLSLASSYVPWKYVLLFAGETVLFAQNPTIQNLFGHLTPRIPTRKLMARLELFIANDALPDHVLESNSICIVACREHQRYGGHGSGWSDSFLDQSSDPRPWMQEQPHHVLQPISGLWAVQPPEGFQWIPSERGEGG